MTVYPFETKACSKCNLQKSVGEFGKCNKSKRGIKSACKVCLRSLGREYAKQKRVSMSNVERQNRIQACKDWREKKIVENSSFYKEEYYKNHNKNKRKQRNFYHKNIAKCLIAQKKWRQENLELVRKISNNWKKNNPDKVKKYKEDNKELYRECARRRRARKRQATIQTFTIKELNDRMSVFGYRCAYCNGPFEHIDHVKPLSKGGPHCLSNLRPACKACNLSKHAKKLSEWLSEAA